MIMQLCLITLWNMAMHVIRNNIALHKDKGEVRKKGDHFER
jgi:hypothetical protein